MDLEVISKRDINRHFQLSPVLGKKVICDNGEVIGKVKDIAFDRNRILGIYVSGAFGMSKLLIDREYISQFDADSVILKINPVTDLVGKIVFDRDGKKLGRVNKVIRKSNDNDFKEVLVKKNIFSRPLQISKNDMDVIGKNIILKKTR